MEKDSGATMATLQHAYNRVSAAVASARSKPKVEEEPFFDDDEAVLSRYHPGIGYVGFRHFFALTRHHMSSIL